MPKFNVTVVEHVWIEKVVVAPDRETAEAKVVKQAEDRISSDGFSWLAGRVEHCGTTNESLLNKIPY